jgi:hypothetical protein
VFSARITRTDNHHLVTVNQTARSIHGKHTVGVAVVGQAQVRPGRDNGFH